MCEDASAALDERDFPGRFFPEDPFPEPCPDVLFGSLPGPIVATARVAPIEADESTSRIDFDNPRWRDPLVSARGREIGESSDVASLSWARGVAPRSEVIPSASMESEGFDQKR